MNYFTGGGGKTSHAALFEGSVQGFFTLIKLRCSLNGHRDALNGKHSESESVN